MDSSIEDARCSPRHETPTERATTERERVPDGTRKRWPWGRRQLRAWATGRVGGSDLRGHCDQREVDEFLDSLDPVATTAVRLVLLDYLPGDVPYHPSSDAPAWDLSRLRRLGRLRRLTVLQPCPQAAGLADATGAGLSEATTLLLPLDVAARLEDGFECTWSRVIFSSESCSSEGVRSGNSGGDAEGKPSGVAEKDDDRLYAEDDREHVAQASVDAAVLAAHPDTTDLAILFASGIPRDVSNDGHPLGPFFDLSEARRLPRLRHLEAIRTWGPSTEPLQLRVPLSLISRLRGGIVCDHALFQFYYDRVPCAPRPDAPLDRATPAQRPPGDAGKRETAPVEHRGASDQRVKDAAKEKEGTGTEERTVGYLTLRELHDFLTAVAPETPVALYVDPGTPRRYRVTFSGPDAQRHEDVDTLLAPASDDWNVLRFRERAASAEADDCGTAEGVLERLRPHLESHPDAAIVIGSDMLYSQPYIQFARSSHRLWRTRLNPYRRAQALAREARASFDRGAPVDAWKAIAELIGLSAKFGVTVFVVGCEPYVAADVPVRWPGLAGARGESWRSLFSERNGDANENAPALWPAEWKGARTAVCRFSKLRMDELFGPRAQLGGLLRDLES